MAFLGKNDYGKLWDWLNRIPEDIVRSSFYTSEAARFSIDAQPPYSASLTLSSTLPREEITGRRK